jgi:hypothetical protein
MRTIKVVSVAIFAAVVTAASVAFVNVNKAKPLIADGQGFAVIELFTSEGCSTCPPADELVAKIQKENPDNPVFILAYHVDYWNRLGWKDVYSSAAFSQRQKDYAERLKLSSVYTPEVVVNGKEEFLGSDEKLMRKAISIELNKIPTAELSLEKASVVKNKAVINYSTKGNTDNTSLLLALVQKNATTKVLKGENAGHTLSHVQIVSKLQSSSLKKKGEASFSLPADFSAPGYEVIGFIQNNESGEITGAARITFPSVAITSN